MKQFMLVIVCDREIFTPMFFDTLEEAQEAMIRDFAESVGVEVPEAIEKYMNNEEWEDDSQITETCAATYTHHSCIDWQIFDMAQINGGK